VGLSPDLTIFLSFLPDGSVRLHAFTPDRDLEQMSRVTCKTLRRGYLAC
jgi:hypothetical protein